MAADVLQRLREAFAEASIVLEPGMVLEETTELDEIDGLDSVSRVRLTIAVETAFSLEITQRENSRIKTIGDIVALVHNKRGSA